jgi:cyclopropane fatty-acyl-phospholipid synthase-like methyltransferase
MSKNNKQYAIASHLLSDSMQALAWSNLGYWDNTSDYITACEQLAFTVGRAAKLNKNTQLLDVACGQGASILFWQQKFAVQQITALDIQADQIRNIQQYFANADDQQIQTRTQILHASFDQPDLPNGMTAGQMDAVVCVDAAYHAQSMAAFLSFCQHALKPNGHLAFCTLLKSSAWEKASTLQKAQHRLLLKLAGVSNASVLSQAELQQQLQQHGLAQATIVSMNDQVLAGFSASIRQRATTLSFSQKNSLAWQKIAMTAKLCDFLHRHKLLDYCVVSAVKIQ